MPSDTGSDGALGVRAVKNEELTTISVGLQTKVIDLSRANNDMVNLLAGTGIGSIFVDLKLHIPRFTPAANTIINLIPSDVGRPLAHIVSVG